MTDLEGSEDLFWIQRIGDEGGGAAAGDGVQWSVDYP